MHACAARRVYAFASHGLFSGPANERIFKSKLEEVVVLNTIPLTPAHEANAKIVQVRCPSACAQMDGPLAALRLVVFACGWFGIGCQPQHRHACSSWTAPFVALTDTHAHTPKQQLSVAPLIAQAIYNIHQKKSISALFK